MAKTAYDNPDNEPDKVIVATDPRTRKMVYWGGELDGLPPHEFTDNPYKVAIYGGWERNTTTAEQVAKQIDPSAHGVKDVKVITYDEFTAMEKPWKGMIVGGTPEIVG
jgi:hypothetical protein